MSCHVLSCHVLSCVVICSYVALSSCMWYTLSAGDGIDMRNIAVPIHRAHNWATSGWNTKFSWNCNLIWSADIIYIVNCSQSAINACPPETCLPIFIFKPDLNMSGIKFIYISFLQKPVHCKPFITVSSFNLYICTRRAPRSFPCHDNLPTPWCRTCQPNHQNMELPALQKHLER
jgi:hypothetical protein